MFKKEATPVTEEQISAKMGQLTKHRSDWKDCVSGGKTYPRVARGTEVTLKNLFPLPHDIPDQEAELRKVAKANLKEEQNLLKLGVKPGAKGVVVDDSLGMMVLVRFTRIGKRPFKLGVYTASLFSPEDLQV